MTPVSHLPLYLPHSFLQGMIGRGEALLRGPCKGRVEEVKLAREPLQAEEEGVDGVVGGGVEGLVELQRGKGRGQA